MPVSLWDEVQICSMHAFLNVNTHIFCGAESTRVPSAFLLYGICGTIFSRQYTRNCVVVEEYPYRGLLRESDRVSSFFG